jgi:hypothetical protein
MHNPQVGQGKEKKRRAGPEAVSMLLSQPPQRVIVSFLFWEFLTTKFK